MTPVLPSVLRLAALAQLLALGAGPAAAGATAPAAAQAISAEVLEARHGLRVTRVAVTGDGGLVDLRFTVVDPAKARPLLEGGHDLGLLAAPGGPAIPAPHHGAMRNVRLARDAACFVLFPNVRGAVRRGGQVAVQFGDVALAGVAVQ